MLPKDWFSACALPTRILLSRIVRQGAHIIHQIPNVIRVSTFPKAGIPVKRIPFWVCLQTLIEARKLPDHL